MVFESSTVMRQSVDREADLDPVRAVKHEVLNSLTPVVAHSWELAQAETDPGKRERLLSIHRAGRAIDRLIRGIDSEADLFSPTFEVVEVKRLLDEAVEEVRPICEERGNSIQLIYDSAARNRVIADPDLIRRLLVNLLLNAIEASPEGAGIVLSARPVKRGVRIGVRDRGPGFEDGDVEDLPDNYTKRPGGVHGTGLSVCRTIAMLHGGTLRSVNLDEGAEVFFVLHTLTGKTTHTTNSKRPRLLVVDDEPAVAESLASLLSSRAEIDMAHHPASALEKLRQQDFDTLLLDMDLGDTSGAEMLAQLEEQGIDRPARVVMMTGDPLVAGRAMRGAQAILGKPFDLGVLEHTLFGTEAEPAPLGSWSPA